MPLLHVLESFSRSLSLKYFCKTYSRRTRTVALGSVQLLVALLVSTLAGCGTGGYPGGGITSLSASILTLDAGQSYSISAVLAAGSPGMQWTLAGATCSGATCGTLSTSSGLTTLYSAPAGTTAPFVTTLTATIPGTSSTKTVMITVNPDPVLTGTPPRGMVGSPYTTSITASLGTAPLTLSVLTGTTPPGLTFNGATGVLSGTPTANGTYTFTVQAVDSSAVPYTVTALETVIISSQLTLAGVTPLGTVGTPYTGALAATGGTGAYTFSLTSGSLPGGLTLSASTGAITGTPTASGTSTFSAQVQDAAGNRTTGTFNITILSGVTLTTTMLPNGTVGVPYSAPIVVSGGTAPYTCVFTAGTLPAGLSLNGCLVSGTPTAAGTSNLTVRATDATGATVAGPESISIAPAPTSLAITTGTLPNGTVGTPYSSTIGVSGGVAPYTCTITGGTLQAGLTLGANCLVSGTPTVAGTANLTVKATDSANPANTTTGAVSLTINPAPALVISSPPSGTVGTPYTGSIPVTGGTGPYTCTLNSGTLPAGLTLAANCTLTGTPTTPGTATVSVTATDSSKPPTTTTGNATITINPAPLAITTGTLPNGTVGTPYSSTIGVSGGVAPYTCTITSGTLQAGLTLGANCLVSGTPTVAGTANLTVKATDSGNPANTTTGAVSLTINPAPALVISSPPSGTVGTPYTGSIPVTGGTGPYTCTLNSGTLPAGLTLAANCTLTGTPTTPGTATVSVTATDSSKPPTTTTGNATITINPAPLAITTGTLPNGTVGTPYSSTIGVSGGVAPYTCTITSGTLQAGLTLGANCLVSGTPTVAGTANLTVKATDSGNPANTTTGAVSLTINPAPALVISSPPSGTVGTPYTGSIPVTGGTGPYTCTLNSGTLPAGLTLAANCTLSGTPTTPGTATVSVTATDSSKPPTTTTGNATITINPAPLAITTGTLPNGTVGTPYSSTIGVSGGVAPYTCAITGGTLQAGLTLGANCLVSGTPTVAGTANLTVKATDSGNPANTTTGAVSLTINPAPALVISSPPSGTVGTPYTGSIPVTGGTGPYTCTLNSGTLPAGLTLAANCTLTGTPTTPGTATVSVTATDSSKPPTTTTGNATITINPAPLAITTGTLPNGTVGTPYSSTIGVSGGVAPYTCTITSGTLQAGLTLGANCLVSGTPTVAGTANLTVKATDSGNPANTTTGAVSLTINPAPALVISSPPSGTVGTPYTGSIPVTGGTGPYTCTLNSGTLPAGLTLAANCTLSGTPTTPGTATVSVTATDSSKPPTTTTGNATITINPAPLAITTGTLPNGTVGTPYSSTIGVSGGVAPYTCTITGGTLQAGLTLGANCLVSGTPTVAGTANLTVKATDSGNPANTTTGAVSLTINPAPALVISSPPSGTVGTPYTGSIPVTGGTGPYTCTLNSGTLPAGLTLAANCTLTGTPTTPGTATVSVTATDSSKPPTTTTGNATITINPAPLAITTGTLPNGTVGTPYSSTIGVSGGVAPYTCTITGGTLQAGLTLGANCLVSGTPTVAGTANLTVRATDSGNPANTTTGAVSLTINPAPALVISSPPSGTVGTPYTGSIPVTGGTGPYTCTLNSGTLPAGLTLAANCTLTGTPTAPGTATVSVTATDSSKPPTTTTGNATITINPAPPTLTLANPPAATVGTPYAGIIPVTGGTAPYTCKLNSGAVPAGLTLTNCSLTGTPTTAGMSSLNITVTDSSNPQGSFTGPVVVTVNPIPPLTFTGSLPNAVLGQAYSQTLAATGGVGPYTYAVASGALPPGLALSAGGIVSGTPTAVGAYSFTATATDAETNPQTANLPLVILVTYPVTPTDPVLNGPYAFLFQGYDDTTAGLTAYQTATAGSFTANGAAVLSAGELDSNHQSSNPTGATISSQQFLGTYTLGADYRGMLTITTLNAAGTVSGTSTYAIAVKPPVAPATTTAQGSLIEFDNNQLAGTRGSGTLLRQTAASIATGLTGSYVFGLQGDTPCLPTCTINLTPGPVASVGVFTVNSGAITGQSDANIAATKFTGEGLTGSYGTADTNGRIQMSLVTAGTPAGTYPSDYAVYMVNANQAFILSTDKHSATILLAGSAQSQTLSTFANTSLSGPFIGYENSPTNPGLVGATLNNTLNLSTATIFRETADAAGTCTVTSVDEGGTTALVNGLSGLGSGAPTLNALLGTYQSLGPATCAPAPNGRVVLNYPAPGTVLASTLGLLGLANTPPPPRIVYLAGIDRGYFLESGFAGLGVIEPQTGQPYSLASFNGNFLYQEVPASSVATTNTSGVLTANGMGSATSTQDLNTGVGTVNVLQLGVTGTYTYTAPDPTTGRFTLNSTIVIYEISPGRFVLVDTNPLLASPSVILLD